jgi:endonuclease/exonuclease/phosphatase family metal-dependent hydrolase
MRSRLVLTAGLRNNPIRPLLALLTAAVLWGTALLAAQPAHGFLDKPTDAAIRVLTWNVYRDSIFPRDGEVVDAAGANRPAQFARVLQALKPDVVCLQEVTASVARSADLVNHILPLAEGNTWQAHGAVDTVILSRFNLAARGEGQVDDGDRRRGHTIALINAPATNLYMICAHFQSSDSAEAVSLRRQQAQLIMSTIREAKTGGGAIPLRARTPFILLGDFNAIAGATLFVDAIITGKAAYAAAGAATGGLDWDRTSLTDARPRHNASGAERYTWRNDLERFQPGILDRIFYSDSVLASVNQFVLDTTTMSYAELVATRLRAIDVMRDPQTGIHDHFPLVIDVVLRPDRQRR